MSASTQGQTLPNNGSGHTRAKPGRKPGQKAAAKIAPPLAAGQQPSTGITGGPSQINVAERRIGPMPIATATVYAPGSINWLLGRQQECQIELRLVNQMIAQFGPRRAATGTTVKKSKAKKHRASPVKRPA